MLCSLVRPLSLMDFPCSLVCDTEADAAARIAATGAGGLFGREYHEDKRYFDEE